MCNSTAAAAEMTTVSTLSQTFLLTLLTSAAAVGRRNLAVPASSGEVLHSHEAETDTPGSAHVNLHICSLYKLSTHGTHTCTDACVLAPVPPET